MLGFMVGLVDLIEPNRRRSLATVRIWRLKIDQRWREDEFKNAKLFMIRPLLGKINHPLKNMKTFLHPRLATRAGKLITALKQAVIIEGFELLMLTLIKTAL